MKQTENEARCTGRRLLERVNLQFCTSQTTPRVWSGAADGKPTALCELRTTLRLHQEVFTSLFVTKLLIQHTTAVTGKPGLAREPVA